MEYDILQHALELVKEDGRFTEVRISNGEGPPKWRHILEEGKRSLVIKVVENATGKFFAFEEEKPDKMNRAILVKDNDLHGAFWVTGEAEGIGIHDIRDIGLVALHTLNLTLEGICFVRSGNGVWIHYPANPHPDAGPAHHRHEKIPVGSKPQP